MLWPWSAQESVRVEGTSRLSSDHSYLAETSYIGLGLPRLVRTHQVILKSGR